MPTLREFLGIPIRMYWDHHPPPHFHTIYGEHEAQYNIATLDGFTGHFPGVHTPWWWNGRHFTGTSL